MEFSSRGRARGHAALGNDGISTSAGAVWNVSNNSKLFRKQVIWNLIISGLSYFGNLLNEVIFDLLNVQTRVQDHTVLYRMKQY